MTAIIKNVPLNGIDSNMFPFKYDRKVITWVANNATVIKFYFGTVDPDTFVFKHVITYDLSSQPTNIEVRLTDV